MLLKGAVLLILEIIVGLYLLVAVMCMWQTLREWREEHRASLLGALGGCVLCLFWLPMFVTIAVYQVWSRKPRLAAQLRTSDA